MLFVFFFTLVIKKVGRPAKEVDINATLELRAFKLYMVQDS